MNRRRRKRIVDEGRHHFEAVLSACPQSPPGVMTARRNKQAPDRSVHGHAAVSIGAQKGVFSIRRVEVKRFRAFRCTDI